MGLCILANCECYLCYIILNTRARDITKSVGSYNKVFILCSVRYMVRNSAGTLTVIHEVLSECT
jgi:hypothetical protein